MVFRTKIYYGGVLTYSKVFKKRKKNTERKVRVNESVCTDVGCSLEQEVLMTETMAHRTTSSRRGLRRPDDPSPARHQEHLKMRLLKHECGGTMNLNVRWVLRLECRVLLKGKRGDRHHFNWGTAHPAVLPAVPETAGAGWWRHGSIVPSLQCPEPSLLFFGGCDTSTRPLPLRN